MATLVSKDTSGTFAAGSDELEVPSRRTRSSKVFRLPDAVNGRRRFRIGAGVGPVHYRQDPFSTTEEYSEVDLDVVLTPGQGWDAACESNGYQVRFWQSIVRDTKTYRCVAQFRRAGRWLAMAPLAVVYENNAGQRQVIGTVQGGITPVIDNAQGYVQWDNAFGPGLHFRYNLQPDRFFKCLVIRSKADLPTPTISSGGRKITLVMALEWDSGVSASNGFAAGVTTALGDGYTEVPDETLQDPAAYSEDDARGPLWWMQQPRAWDSADPRNSVAVSWRLQRRGPNVYAGFSVGQAAVNAAVYPLYIDTAITEEAVGATSDDGYSEGTTWPGFATTSLIYSTDFLGGASTVSFSAYGARFDTVPIPAGATIETAALTVQSVYPNNANLHVTFYGDAHPDAATFASGTDAATGNPGSRSRTSANVDWNVGSTLWNADGWYASPDLATVVQEIVDLTGWASDNAIAILCHHFSATLPGVPSQRYISTYDRARPPKFNATYTEGATSSIKGIGIALAGIKSVGGVPVASVKKIAGVANS